MKKIIVISIISLLFISCDTPKMLGFVLDSGYSAKPVTTNHAVLDLGFNVIPHTVVKLNNVGDVLIQKPYTRKFEDASSTFFATGFHQEGYLLINIKIDELVGDICTEKIYITYPKGQTEFVQAILSMYYNENGNFSDKYDYYAVNIFDEKTYLYNMFLINQFEKLDNYYPVSQKKDINPFGRKSLEGYHIVNVAEPVMVHLIFRCRRRPTRFELYIPLSDQQGNKTEIRIPFDRVE